MEYLEILNKAISNDSSLTPDEEVLKVAMVLVRDLPPCRDIVLEYLCMLFRHFVDDHLRRIKVKDDSADIRYSRMVADIERHLKHLISTDPPLWSFMLAKWSIDLLGRLDNEVGAHLSNIPATNPLLLWANCLPTQSLIHILNQSLHHLSMDQLYLCFDNLLATSNQNTSCLDWAIAQISSSFPEEIVWRMLQCGLKDFHYNSIFETPPNQPSSSSDKGRGGSHEGKVMKVVGILSHLTEHNQDQIYKILLKFLQESLRERRPEDVDTPLFLLHLALHSSALLNIIIHIFFHFVTPRVLKGMVRMVQKGCSIALNQMTDMLVSVVLNTDHQATQLLDAIACLATLDFSAYPADDTRDESVSEEDDKKLENDIAYFSSNLLNMVAMRIQMTTSLSPNEFNLINSLNTNLPSFSRLFRPPFVRKKLLFKMVTSFCSFFPSSSSQLLSLIFVNSRSDQDMAIFREMERVISFKQPSILHDTLGRLLAMVEGGDEGLRFELVLQLHRMCLLESHSAFNQHSFGTDICRVLTEYQFRLIKLFYFPPHKSTKRQDDHKLEESKLNGGVDLSLRGGSLGNVETHSRLQASRHSKNIISSSSMLYDYNVTLLELLRLIQSKVRHRVVEQADVLECSTIFINLLFTSFLHLRGQQKWLACRGIVRQLRIMSQHNSSPSQHSSSSSQHSSSSSQHLIRTLVVEAFSNKYQGLFQRSPTSASRRVSKGMVRAIVPCFDKSLQACNLHSSEDDNKFGLLFHSGTIGTGVKSDDVVVSGVGGLEEDELLLNEFLLLHAVQACCKATTANNSKPNPSTKHPTSTTTSTSAYNGFLAKDVVRVLSSCLMEQCMPDGLYSTVHWSDEEFIKLTYARDLVVKKEFESNNLLRKLLDILILSKSGIWMCTSILRSVLGHLVSYWETCRWSDVTDSHSQLHLTRLVITLMKEGRLLPTPLCLISDLLTLLSPYEIFLLLLEIWKYLKENNPVPNSNTTCDPKYTALLRMVMMDNIEKCGHLFPLFFR